jgi:hypothetical protein
MSSEQQNSSFQEFLATNRMAVVLGVIAVVALVAACVFGALLLFPDGGVVEDATATPFQGTPVAGSGCGDALVVGISDSSTITVSLDAPLSLQVGEQDYAVRTQVIAADGVWVPEAEEGTAVWVCGTLVNYVFGLPSSEENESLLEQLELGDEMMMTTRGGTDYIFTFNSRALVPANDRDIFAQNRPGITLVLLGMRGEERMVVTGRYVVAEATDEQGNVVELGETAQLDDIRITVTGAAYVPDRPEVPSGFAFYQIDYQIENVGLTALDTSQLELLLLDDLGNRYALNPLASQLGNHPPLSGFLNAGQMVQATAGYQIPVGLTSATLNWVVARSDTGSQVQVRIPFTGGSRAAQAASVSLTRAEVSPDLTSLDLTGQVSNVGDQPIVITEEEVSLESNEGAVYLLLSTNPRFPWTVAPGETLQFSVTFQRPPVADTAVFTILNQSFQLTGLR